jgi:alkaline phosphatase
MIRFAFLISICLISFSGVGQHSSSSIFAHNDYEKTTPLMAAYNAQVGFIEADVLLQGHELLVAHSANEIQKDKTLESLYLNPLNELIEKNGGNAYPDKEKSLTLMIDLKTEAITTLNVLVFKLKKYPKLIACKTLMITVSGNTPAPALWKNYPDFIHFDGRLGITYTTDQQKRIRLISASFQSYSKWTGKEPLKDADKEKLVALIESAHAIKKPFRFWAIPDFENGWRTLMELGVDIVNTDDVAGATAFVK